MQGHQFMTAMRIGQISLNSNRATAAKIPVLRHAPERDVSCPRDGALPSVK